MHLAPCPGCNRHVGIAAEKCPFCESALGEPAARAAPTGRLSRAAQMAFSAAVATSVLAGCGDKGGGDVKSPTGNADGGAQVDYRHPGGGGDGNLAKPYGAPPADGRRIV